MSSGGVHVTIRFESVMVKTMIEKFCVLQQQATSLKMKDFYGDLIAQLEVYRPVAADGKHTGKGLCTGMCGCKDRSRD